MNTPDSNIPKIITPRFTKILLAGTALAVVLTYVITLPVFFTPCYQSEAIGFPPGMFQFSEDGSTSQRAQSDAFVQVLKSTVLADSLDRLFHLAEHFGVHGTHDEIKSRILQELNNRMTVEINRYGAISVIFVDYNADLAAEMANSVIVEGNKIWNAMILKEGTKSNAGLISYAVPAHKPAKPKRPLLMMLAGGLTAFILIAIRIIQYGAHHEIGST